MKNSFSVDTCKYNFASDNINIFVMVYDISTSMEDDRTSMRKANKAFYDDFLSFEERGSISIAKAEFNENFAMGSFDEVKNFNVSYDPDGNTALYEAIARAGNNTIEYYKEIVKRLNVRPRITFLVFSDGDDNCSESYMTYARAAVKELNSVDATTVFVAFRDAIYQETGASLGFTCTKNIRNVNELVSCMGTELSKSCKEQSKSAYSLKSEFFSKAEKNSAEDNVKEQAIFDDGFFDDVL